MGVASDLLAYQRRQGPIAGARYQACGRAPRAEADSVSGLRRYATTFNIAAAANADAGVQDGANRGWRVSARDQYLCAAAGDLGRFRARRCLARLYPRARADRRGRGVQHPDRRRSQNLAGAGARAGAVVLVLGAAL